MSNEIRGEDAITAIVTTYERQTFSCLLLFYGVERFPSWYVKICKGQGKKKTVQRQKPNRVSHEEVWKKAFFGRRRCQGFHEKNPSTATQVYFSFLDQTLCHFVTKISMTSIKKNPMWSEEEKHLANTTFWMLDTLIFRWTTQVPILVCILTLQFYQKKLKSSLAFAQKDISNHHG